MVKELSELKKTPTVPEPVVEHPDLGAPDKVKQLVEAGEELLDQKPGRLSARDQMVLFKAMHACSAAMQSKLAKTPRQRRRWEQAYTRMVERLFEANVGLAHAMIGRCSLATTVDEDEMISVAYWSLFRSVQRFDPWRGFRFSTYACNAIMRGLQSVIRREHRQQQVIRSLSDELQIRPHPEDEPKDEVSLLMDRVTTTLDSSAADLTPRERFVLERRYLHPQEERAETLATLARALRLSRERVRQIQMTAVAKLRAALQRDPVLQAAGLTPPNGQ